MVELIEEGFQTKQEILRLKKELDEINEKIVEKAVFEDKNTTYFESKNVKVKVSKTDSIKWDQERLNVIKPHFPFFDNVFKTEYKHSSKKGLDLKKAEFKKFGEACDWASTTTTRTSISYELTS